MEPVIEEIHQHPQQQGRRPAQFDVHEPVVEGKGIDRERDKAGEQQFGGLVARA